MRVRLVAVLALVLAGCPQWHDAPLSASTTAGGDAAHVASSEWTAVPECGEIHPARPSEHLRAGTAIDELQQAASCWLTEDELATVDVHRRELRPDGAAMRAAYAAADRAARTFTADALDAAARDEDAATVRAIPPIVDDASRATAEATLRTLLAGELNDAIPPASDPTATPAIPLEENGRCTLDHIPAVTTSTSTDATIAMAIVTLVAASAHMDARTMLPAVMRATSATACLAAMSDDGREQAVDDLMLTMSTMAAPPPAPGPSQ